MVMYLNAYVHFSQFSGFCADFRINFAQIFASVKTYVKNRGSHESSYRSSKQFKFSAEITAERTDGRTNEQTNENEPGIIEPGISSRREGRVQVLQCRRGLYKVVEQLYLI